MNPLSKCVKLLIVIIFSFSVSACATTVPRPDYAAYHEHYPKSILVLPPLNESLAVTAPYTYLSTISKPLAECGYYVFPVAVIDAFLKENGLPTPGEMHNISLQKIHDIIGADAVLYVTIEDWGQKYQVLSSNTVIKARAQLVHVRSGTTIWNGTQNVVRSSGDGGGGLAGMLIGAIVTQIVNTIADPTHALAKQANDQMVFNGYNGLLWGSYNEGEHPSAICSH